MQMSGALFFVALMGWAAVLMLLVPKLRAGAALMGGFCAMLFAAYYGVIIAGLMRPTAYVIMIGGLVAFGVGAAAFVCNWRNLRRRLVCIPAGFYILSCLLIAWSANGLIFNDHDAYSFWARAAKELYTFDRFYIHGEVNMYHMDYIPLLAALQYAIVRVFGWQEAFLTYVPAVCMVTCTAAMAELLPGWRKRIAFCALGVYAYIAFGFDILNLRADGPMLMLFTAGVVCLFARKDSNVSSLLTVLCAAMVLTGLKIYSGLMFSAVLAAALGFEWLRLRRAHQPTGFLGTAFWISVVSIVLMHMSWSILYNYTSAAAAAQAAAARAAYVGKNLSDTEAAVELGTLLSGNYRTKELLSSFTPEKIANFLALAKTTIVMYIESKLKGAPLFALLASLPVLLCEKEDRKRFLRVLVWLITAGMVYLFGLFASYFVQAETAPAAVVYLSTVSSPFLIAGVFAVLHSMKGRAKWPSAAVLAVMTGLLVFFLPPELMVFQHSNDRYNEYETLAHSFYTEELNGLITAEDAGKSALLIDSTEASAQLRSRSYKTHVYQYYALPLRVAEPTYLPYGEEDPRGQATAAVLYDRLKYFCSDLLILRIEDEAHWQAVRDALNLHGENDTPFGVYDVSYADGQFRFSKREPLAH